MSIAKQRNKKAGPFLPEKYRPSFNAFFIMRVTPFFPLSQAPLSGGVVQIKALPCPHPSDKRCPACPSGIPVAPHLPGRKGCFSGPKHPLSRPSPVKGDCLSPAKIKAPEAKSNPSLMGSNADRDDKAHPAGENKARVC